MGKEFETLGIVEFSDWIYSADAQRPNRNRDEPEVHACLRAHRDAGLKRIAFSIGRSVVEYHSRSPLVTRYAGKADMSRVREFDIQFMREMERGCPLRTAVDFCAKNGMTIHAHLCMNRHYGREHYGNALTSALAMREEMQEVNKDRSRDSSRLCFALEAYHAERLAIIEEVTGIGVDGICLDFVRQPPMLRYHPAVTEPYTKAAGRDPREISVDSEPDAFLDWCAYRAGVLTAFMRKVRKALRKMEVEHGRRIPLIVRITDDGLTANMIAGIDIETWCRDGIVDCVLTHPLQWIHGIWTHEVAPYVDLGRRTGVKILGGVNTYPVHKGFQFNPVCIARRVREQYDAGVAGISLYETNDAVLRPELAPLLGSLAREEDLAALLADTRWTGAWPINGLNANCGMDNHSGSPREVLYGL